jgi:hypothetical protein
VVVLPAALLLSSTGLLFYFFLFLFFWLCSCFMYFSHYVIVDARCNSYLLGISIFLLLRKSYPSVATEKGLVSFICDENIAECCRKYALEEKIIFLLSYFIVYDKRLYFML